MTKDALNERRKALEDEFFHRVDEKLLADMRQKSASEINRKDLQQATGITDVAVLDELLAAGAIGESVAAISLVPLVLVAWADGKIDPDERKPILKAAEDKGIVSDSPGAKLLEHWLTQKPKRELASTWKHYIAAVNENLGSDAKAALRDDILGRARAVANASGGVLGFGKISSDEKRVLEELEQVLSK
jgi:tellurite resistance protein